MKKGFMKFSDERNRKYSIKTDIDFSSDKKSVVKRAIFTDGEEHLNHIISSFKKLEEFYSDIEICNVKKIDDGVEFEFIEGRLLLDDYFDMMQQNDVAGYERILKRHRDIVIGNEKNKCEFKSSEEFEKWFGDSSSYENKEGLLFSNFDAIAGNIIMRDDNPVFIDYEWTFDFVVPKDLVIYHCIYDAYIHNPDFEDFYPMDKVIQLLDIKTEKDVLESSYKKFFDYIICDENGDSYAKDKFKCLKPSYSVPYIASEWNKCADEWNRAVEANKNINKELDDAKAEWEKCANLWKEAVAANDEKDKTIKHINKEWQKCSDEWKKSVEIVQQITSDYKDLESRYADLNRQYDELTKEHEEVINSRVWKINTKIHSVLNR